METSGFFFATDPTDIHESDRGCYLCTSVTFMVKNTYVR
jgi:hypothetical protein